MVHNICSRGCYLKEKAMKSSMIILGLSIMLAGGGYVLAADQNSDKGSMMMDHESMMEGQGMMQSEGKEDESKAVEVGNKICPVSGEKVGEMGEIVKYEYNGKIYNLCCPMCQKDFSKNPEKYSKIAEDEVAKEKESK